MPLTLNDDRVWFDSTIKLEQLCRAVADAHPNSRNVVLLSHFESTVSQLTNQLRAAELRFERFSLFDAATVCASGPGRVWIGEARAFQAPNALVSSATGTAVEIIVAEHHPLRTRDEAIIEAATKLSCQAELSFHFSLDDPLMKYFGSTSIQELFTRLGIPRDECISHQFVSTAIRNAQEKIESRAPKDVTTPTVEEWFKYNLPN